MTPQEYLYVRQEIRKLIGVDLDGYKAEQMQRRLNAFLFRSGFSSWNAFFTAKRHDAEALVKLRDALTINVTSFFRDADKYQQLRDKVVPLLAKGRQRLRVWSAGCSHGHEPYSLAIVLSETLGPHRYELLATDIDRAALDCARAGGPYREQEAATIEKALLTRHFAVRDGAYWAQDSLRQRITFRPHDLLVEEIGQTFDLIVCRNVVIYFTAEAKDRLYPRFYSALRPGGVLFVGGTEFVPRAQEIGFKVIGSSFYQRPDTVVGNA
jgi:chemotaxis protein methyltransferase CheR